MGFRAKMSHEGIIANKRNFLKCIDCERAKAALERFFTIEANSEHYNSDTYALSNGT